MADWQVTHRRFDRRGAILATRQNNHVTPLVMNQNQLPPIMSRYQLLLAALLLPVMWGCQPAPKQRTDASVQANPAASEAPPRKVPAFAQPIEQAHGAAAFRQSDALRFEFALRFGADTELLVEVVMKTDLSRIRMQKTNGAKLIWDGEYAYATPADATWARPRFTVRTWPYFLAAPFMLADSGTRLDPQGTTTLMDSAFSTAKLTFEPEVGDSTDDWYLLYRHDSTGLLRAMAYIATGGEHEAQADPHAITYHYFTEVEGVKLPTEFRFWDWSEEAGLGKRLGTARLANFRFIQTDKFTFGIPLSYRKYDAQGEEVE